LSQESGDKTPMNENKPTYFGDLNKVPHWYALRTKYRHEKKVDNRLQEKGLTSYLPLNTVYHKWSDRQKKITVPLFSCYVFVYMIMKDQLRILQTDGAVNLVSFNGKPSPIPENQIDAIKLVLGEKNTVEQVRSFTPGKKVRIKQGVFKGLEGVLVENKNNYRFVICIDSINQGIALDIGMNDLELV